MVVRGVWHVVEHAQRADGSQPSREFFRALINKDWLPDPDRDRLPPDAQLEDYHRFLHDCHYLATNGRPERLRVVNDLDDGIWEFKHRSKRLSFFDTPGDGTFTPKPMIEKKEASPYPDDDAWWFPVMDEYIRLGYAFPKEGETAGEFNIDQTLAVREEDISHDRESGEDA